MIHHLTRILYINFISFGDILVSTSLICKLKEKHTNSIIDYYTTGICAPLLIGNPDIHQIFTERNPPKQLEKYDVVLRPYRCLQETPYWHQSGKHSTDLLAEICGVDLKGDYRLFFYNIQETTLPAPKYILIQCKTGDPAKDYDLFPELVQLINRTIRIPVFQIGGNNDLVIPETAGFIKNETWPKVAYIISKALQTICLDSITQHLCGALNVPYIAINGAKNHLFVASGIVNGVPTGVHQYFIDPSDRNGCPTWCNLGVCQNLKGKCINNILPESIVELIDKTIQEG